MSADGRRCQAVAQETRRGCWRRGEEKFLRWGEEKERNRRLITHGQVATAPEVLTSPHHLPFYNHLPVDWFDIIAAIVPTRSSLVQAPPAR